MIPVTLLKQKRNQHVEALERALAKIVAQFSCLPEVERIVLFGSYAAGRWDLFTDLDLLVVMSAEFDFVHRTAEVYSQLTVDVDLDLLGYTPKEFEEQRDKGLIKRAIETGRVLYEKKSP